MNRDGARKSIWQEEIKSFSSDPDFETVYDVAIVGGGITGVSTALKLQQEGKKCIILEASNIGFGTTGILMIFLIPLFRRLSAILVSTMQKYLQKQGRMRFN